MNFFPARTAFIAGRTLASCLVDPSPSHGRVKRDGAVLSPAADKINSGVLCPQIYFPSLKRAPTQTDRFIPRDGISSPLSNQVHMEMSNLRRQGIMMRPPKRGGRCNTVWASAGFIMQVAIRGGQARVLFPHAD